MHLTLSAAPKPPLLRLAAPVAPPAQGTGENFAALLESLDIETLQPAQVKAPEKAIRLTDPKKAPETKKPTDVKKNDPAPCSPAPTKAKEETPGIEAKQEVQPDVAAALPLLTVIPTPVKPEVLPLVFTLPAPLIVPTSAEAAPASDKHEPEPAALKPATPQAPAVPLLSLAFAPLALPPPHTQAKEKMDTPSEAEPLQTLQLPLKDTPKETRPAEIAFEAKLTAAPDQHKPSAPPPSATSTQPQAPREESKTPDKPVPQALKPDHATAAYRQVDSPVKTFDSPAIAVPTPHIDKTASPAPARQEPAPAATAPDTPDLPVLKTEPARDISFRIASTPTDAVDVKLVDRAGEIHVAVRSSDPALTQSLQANVTELAGKLERAGFQAETLLPNRANPVHQPQQNPAFQDFQQDRRAPQQEFQPRKKRTAVPTATFTLNPNQENS